MGLHNTIYDNNSDNNDDENDDTDDDAVEDDDYAASGVVIVPE